jgi:putative flippase GtrA
MMQLVRYALVGVLNTGVGYAVIFLCMGVFGWNHVVSNVAGYAVGLATSFLLNRNFTFRSTGAARAELKRFLLIFAVSYLANLAVLVLLVDVMGISSGWTQLIAGIVYSVLFFLLSKYYVFIDGAEGRSRSKPDHV